VNGKLEKAITDCVLFLDSVSAEQGPSGDYFPSDSKRALELRGDLLEAFDEAKAEERRKLREGEP